MKTFCGCRACTWWRKVRARHKITTAAAQGATNIKQNISHRVASCHRNLKPCRETAWPQTGQPTGWQDLGQLKGAKTCT